MCEFLTDIYNFMKPIETVVGIWLLIATPVALAAKSIKGGE